MAGERRQLTVLFCDLVDSTALAEELDPEDFGELILGYQEMAREIVNRFGGVVAQFLGDGILAYFGSPVANEDDADRAVMTGLAILDHLVEYRQAARQLGADSLEARVGIHTGPVVVGSMGGPDRADISLFGSSTNIASRLEGFAAPRSVVASEMTVRLLRGRYSLANRGTPELKGIRRHFRVWQVLGAIESVEPRHTLGKGAVVGRSTEIASLRHAVDLATSEGCQVVLVRGEPGVGKSTLLHSLFDALAERPHRWLEFQCSELASATPLEPVILGIRRLVGIHQTDSTQAQVAKLGTALQTLGAGSAEAMPFIADLLGVGADTHQVLEGLSPDVRRHRTLEALTEWAAALATESLLVLVTEDLHWADPTTVELLARLAERATRLPVALIVTSRKPLPTPWQPLTFTEIPVSRLSSTDSLQLVSHLAAGLDLPSQALGVLAERGGGIPLFLEELVRSVADGSDPSGALPETLQSVLLASLDSLGDAKFTAQAASVLGREFSVAVLAALLEVDQTELIDTLDRLTAAGILSTSLSTEGRRYSFRHALIQDAAHASVLRRTRRDLHGRASDVLTHQFPLVAEESPALLAHHCLAAGNVNDAARWYTAAGRLAVEKAALQEAVSHYESGIQILRDADVWPERDRLLLTLYILCNNAIMGTTGLGHVDFLKYSEAAMTLAEQMGDVDELTSAMNGVATYWFDQGRLDLTIEMADRILAIGEDSGSRVAALRGHCTLGVGYLLRGETDRSLHHLTTGIALEEEGDFFTITYGVGHDEGVLARCMASWAQWWLGRPDASLTAATDADQRAQALPSSMTQAMARYALALSHFLRGEAEQACAVAGENVVFCEELGVPFWLSLSLLVLGTQRALLGNQAGLLDLDRAFGVLIEIGNQSASPVGLAMLAEAQRTLGFPDRALLTADAGLAAAEDAGQAFYEPELIRVKAMATAAVGDPEHAVSLLRRSITSAKVSGAASFQLLSATDFARLVGQDDELQAEVRGHLGEALGAMGDGSDTAPQVAARRLLAPPDERHVALPIP